MSDEAPRDGDAVTHVVVDAGAPPGRVVSLGTMLSPRGKLEMVAVKAPYERTDVPRKGMTPEEIGKLVDQAVMGGTPGGILLARVLMMNEADKAQVLQHAAKDDPLVLWFALLPKTARAEIVNAALREMSENAH